MSEEEDLKLMEKEIKVFEPPMCCPSGVCGPAPDRELVDFNVLIKQVEEEGYVVKRFMLTRDAAEFKKEEQVMALVQNEQLEALPITVIKSKIIKKSNYPTYDEIVNAIY